MNQAKPPKHWPQLIIPDAALSNDAFFRAEATTPIKAPPTATICKMKPHMNQARNSLVTFWLKFVSCSCVILIGYVNASEPFYLIP